MIWRAIRTCYFPPENGGQICSLLTLMVKRFSVTTDFHGQLLTLEVNRVGFRSTASVLVRYGDTVVLGTAQVGSRPVQRDYFPLEH